MKRILSLLSLCLCLPALAQVSITAEAAFDGSFGMEVNLAAATAFVQDDTPDNDASYFARFYFDHSQVDLDAGDGFRIFEGQGTGVSFGLDISLDGDDVVLSLTSGGSTVQVGVLPVGYNAVEINFRGDAGEIDMFINGDAATGLSGLNLAGVVINSARLGNNGKTGTPTGTARYDAFVSRRAVTIGPLSCIPDFDQRVALWPNLTVLNLIPLLDQRCPE